MGIPFDYSADDYNYADFVLRREIPYFERFRERLHVGEQPPDFELVRIDDGERIRLSDYWSAGHVIIEFGSFT